MMEEIVVGAIYRHFKGEDRLYRVVSVARDCENPSQEVVVYEQLYETEDFSQGTVWFRSLEDFIGYKVFEDGRRVKRFEFFKNG
jgi:hypothetical protein